MKFCINNLDDELIVGLKIVAKYLNIEFSNEGMYLYAQKITERKIVIKKDGVGATIYYHQKSDFFYAITKLIGYVGEEIYLEEIECHLKDFGVMLDCSRNAVLNLSAVKDYIVYLALMGYNYLELYTEDTYEIEGEEYFGYMRGRYTREELCELDRYSYIFGIELIPCIQTMAHLDGIFKWNKYQAIRDTEDILLLRDERTYALIDKMFQTLHSCLSSRRIHLGMDEAWLLGSGNFLQKNGYVPRYEILKEHLHKVLELAKKYGYEIAIWNDMFFRVENQNQYAPERAQLSDDLIASIPKGVKLIYWNYSIEEEEIYKKALKNSLRLSQNTGFAGGVLSWSTFTADNGVGMHKIKPAVDACKACGIEDILVTKWGDDGSESSCFSVIPTLCAYSEYVHKGTFDSCDGVLKLLFGYTLNEFKSLDCVNRYVDLEKMPKYYDYYGNTAKYMLYNDLFYGLLDDNVPDDARRYGRGNYALLNECARRESPVSYLFVTMRALAKVLITKADLSKKIKRAYDQRDMDTLNECIRDVQKTGVALKSFIVAYEKQWLRENKPFGLEVQQIRLGGLLERLRYIEKRLRLFVKGEISTIEELQVERLAGNYANADGTGNYNPIVSEWQDIVTCGRVVFHK